MKKQFNHFSTFRIKTIKLDLHVLHKKLAIQLFNFGGIKIRSLKLKSNTQFIRMFNNDELRVVFKNQSRFLREEVERTWRENKDEIRQKIINKEKESLR